MPIFVDDGDAGSGLQQPGSNFESGLGQALGAVFLKECAQDQPTLEVGFLNPRLMLMIQHLL